MEKVTRFKNAQDAFLGISEEIMENGVRTPNTKRIKNLGFIIENPEDNLINVPERNWSHSYAEAEWQWYLTGDRSVKDLAKRAPIWNKMHSGDFIVNSNYGYQWNRNDQLKKAVDKLRDDQFTRQAWVTILDRKEHDIQEFDVPCTIAIGFSKRSDIVKGKLTYLLDMEVLMRSNDLWFGFCNDQYCFSTLQKAVAYELNLKVGEYYHYASDMHIYDEQAIKVHSMLERIKKEREASIKILEQQALSSEVDFGKTSRYNRYPVETIEMMERIWGTEKTADFCLMNAFKYRMRLGLKDSVDKEISKENQYLMMYKKLKEKTVSNE